MFDVNQFVSKQYRSPSTSVDPNIQNDGLSTSDSSGGNLNFDQPKPSKVSSSGGFDVNQVVAEQYKPIPTEPIDDSQKLGGVFSGKGGKEGAVLDVVSAGTKYVFSKALEKKSIPQGIFDDAALGIGKVQGWCGDYATRMSTAKRVGNSWSEKLQRIDKREGIKAGDKILIPLGVSYVNGKPVGYGHVMVAITDQDVKGNFAIANSNADGRQNRGQGPGIATLGVYNVNELNNRYKNNWGAASGKLKINPFKDKNALKNMATQLIPSKAQLQSPELLANFVTDNGIEDLQSQDWWKNSPAKKEAWKIIQGPGQSGLSSSNKVMGSNQATGSSGMTDAEAIRKLGGLAFGAASTATTAFVKRMRGPTNDQAPPDSDKADLTPEALANWVMDNNVGDLQNKKWWVNSPVKERAWEIIRKARPEIPKFGGQLTLSQGDLGKPEEQAGNQIVQLIGDILDPNSIVHQGSTDNEIAARADLEGNINKVGKVLAGRIEEVQSENQGNPLIDNPLGNAIYGSLYQVATGTQKLSGGVNGEGTSVVGGLKEIGFGSLGLVNPAVAKFNVTVNLPGIKPVAEEAFKQWDKVKVAVKDLPIVRDLPQEGKELLDLGMDVVLFKKLHDGIGKIKKFATTKTVNYTPEQVRSVLSDITTGKAGENTPLRQEMRKIFDGVKEGVTEKAMLKRSYKEGITLTEARNFSKWFNKFFDGFTKKSDIQPNLSSEFTKLLTDGKKVQSGEMSAIEFTKQAREVFTKGESATLRDSLPAKMDGQNMALYDQTPQGKPVFNTYAEAATRLNDLKEQGKQEVVSATHGDQKALSIQTYTYSDGKVGVGFDLATDQQNIHAPISGAFENPREAVQKVIPIIEKAVFDGSDTASEVIRTEIDQLKESNFETVPKKGEIAPGEDNYIPPEKHPDIQTMSKEVVQGEINRTVNEYIKTALNDGKGMGVEPYTIKAISDKALIEKLSDKQKALFDAGTPAEQKRALEKLRLRYEVQNNESLNNYFNPEKYIKENIPQAIQPLAKEVGKYSSEDIFVQDILKIKDLPNEAVARQFGKELLPLRNAITDLENHIKKAVTLNRTLAEGKVGESVRISAPINSSTPWYGDKNYNQYNGSINSSKVTIKKINSQSVTVETTDGKIYKVNKKAQISQDLTKQTLIQSEQDVRDFYKQIKQKIVKAPGRSSNNPEWYRKAYAETNARPTQAKLREIAIDHLSNGVTDASIGEMPPNIRFQKLIEALPKAKTEKALQKQAAREKASVAENATVSKSTISTPESRAKGVDQPLQTSGEVRKSEAFQGKDSNGEPQKVPEYQKASINTDVARGKDFVDSNYDAAQKIMRGLDNPPEDVTRGSILQAIRDRAIAEGNTSLEAEAKIALAKYQTRTGQNLVMLKGNILDNKVETFIQQVLSLRSQGISKSSLNFVDKNKTPEARIAAKAKDLKNEFKEKTVKMKKQKSIERAQSIIDQLTCKI